MGFLRDEVAPVRAFCPPPTTPPVTPPNDFVAPPVTPPTVLFAVPTPPVSAFFAPLTWFPPGYLFAPSGFGPTDLDPPVVGLFDAGNEFDRLTTGLRAVDGRALGEGWYVCPDIEVPYFVALCSMPACRQWTMFRN
jgi:hypothetical protein